MLEIILHEEDYYIDDEFDMKVYAADFETTTKEDDCRVWAWGLCEINDEESFEYGNTIEGFITRIFDENMEIFFHNLKFDGEFIINYLLNEGFKFIADRKLNNNDFTTLISDQGVFYNITAKRNNKVVKFYDSLKLIPFSIDKIAKTFNMPISKLHIDYNEYREYGQKLTDKEVNYLKHDVLIMCKALKFFLSNGLTKTTIGSNALDSYKKIMEDKFNILFPVPNYDKFIRDSYKGGFTYANKRFAGKIVNNGIVLDVNSLYPSVMYYNQLPYGEPIYGNGRYKENPVYNLYIQNFSCRFELKQGYLPTIQLKNTLQFIPTDYLESSGDEYVTMTLTNIDLELMFEHYEVYDIQYNWYYAFMSKTDMFKEYIDKWNDVKIKASKDGNEGMRVIAKLMLNNLYGKFATNPKTANKEPYLNEYGLLKYKIVEKEDKPCIYIPIGCFITAWARYKTITAAQSLYDRFLYADTDSLHLLGSDIPKELDVDPYRLGAWKHESTFTRGKYIRAKCYVEEINGQLSVKCAGMPAQCHDQVTFDNFDIGLTCTGKLRYEHCRNGIVLVDTPFTIK